MAAGAKRVCVLKMVMVSLLESAVGGDINVRVLGRNVCLVINKLNWVAD